MKCPKCGATWRPRPTVAPDGPLKCPRCFAVLARLPQAPGKALEVRR